MITDPKTLKQLRRELWELIRFWRYEDETPYPPASNCEFTKNIKHAICYWKSWLNSKQDFRKIKFHACYRPSNSDKQGTQIVYIPPDRSEYKDIDYTLFDITNGNDELVCMIESEFGKDLTETKIDFPKLCKQHSPIKVMIYGVDYAYKVAPAISFGEKIRYFQDTMTAHIQSGHIKSNAVEEWLFIGCPYKRPQDWKPKASDNCVSVKVFSFPTDGQVILRDPDWDIWKKNQAMEDWLWLQHLAK